MIPRYWIFPKWIERRIKLCYVAGALLLAISLVLDVFLVVELNLYIYIFQRTGALVVVVGILLGFYSILQMANVASHGRFHVEIATQLGSAKIRRKNRNKPPHEIEQLVQNNIERAEKEATEATTLVQGSNWLFEAIPIAIGTIVWGFGDLITKLVVWLWF